MTVTGFVFTWRVYFNEAAAGKTTYQRVSTKIEAKDAGGRTLHSLDSGVIDLLATELPEGGYGFSDTQDATGLQSVIDQWVNQDPSVCSIEFRRRGDMRVTDGNTIQIGKFDGSTEWYNKAIHGEGQVLTWFIINSTINGTNQLYGNYRFVRVTGNQYYRIVWHDEVWSVVTGRNPARYKIKGKLTWDQGKGGADGVVGMPVFPDKPAIEARLGYGIDVDFTSQWYPR